MVSPTVTGLRKLNTGAQLQAFPYPTASESFLYSNAFMAKSGAQTLTFKSVTNRQTNKQTKNPTSPTKLGMVIQDLEHVLAPLGGAENLGITRPRQLKTP